jgi:hypothetical protein
MLLGGFFLGAKLDVLKARMVREGPRVEKKKKRGIGR